MKVININELSNILEHSDDFTKELSKYVDVVYTDDGFDFVPKGNLKVIDDDGTEIYNFENSLMLKDRRGFVLNTNSQWTLASKSIFKNSAFKGVFNPFKDFIIDIERKNRIKKFYSKKKSGNYNRIVISCGDSWLQHPLNKDIIDALEESHNDYAIYCIARAGKELREIINEKEFISPLKTEKASAFIFSAGGNDILDDVSLFVHNFDVNKSPREHLNQDYFNKLDQLKYWYKEVFLSVIQYSKSIDKIIVHSYDYPIPVSHNDGRSGNWIGKKLDEKRNIKDRSLQKKIITEVINDIYAILHELSTSKEFLDKIILLDFRGKFTKASEWFDEIHPNKSSNKILANIIANQIS